MNSMTPAMTPKLSLKGIHKSFATRVRYLQVLNGVDIDVAQGGFLSVIGPSGCSKTTVFNIIASLTEPDEGSIFIDGVAANGLRDSGVCIRHSAI
jgi:ABC-type sugar transport system ATPase subunit